MMFPILLFLPWYQNLGSVDITPQKGDFCYDRRKNIFFSYLATFILFLVASEWVLWNTLPHNTRVFYMCIQPISICGILLISMWANVGVFQVYEEYVEYGSRNPNIYLRLFYTNTVILNIIMYTNLVVRYYAAPGDIFGFGFLMMHFSIIGFSLIIPVCCCAFLCGKMFVGWLTEKD